ncbi:MAG: restriction endonuclease subunit S [Verrucomicrobiota bacterium]
MKAFPKYDRYKDSGVEWLGQVPEHWEVRRNLGIFDERKEANQPDAELLSVTQDRGIIRQAEITAKKDSSNDDKSKYKVVKVGDIAYNKMRAWQGAIGVSPYNGIVSPAYIVLTPRNGKLSKFFHYLFRTPTFITEANRLSYGLCDDMNSLRYEHFKTSYSPLPPDDDIDRIVAFLDEKTGEIDALIAKKQRQIELLDEQKAILINRAVTRGLNPDVPLKDSGVPWIGQIPEHWEVKKLKYLINIQAGYAFASGSYSSKCTDTRLLRGINVNPGQITWDEVVYWPNQQMRGFEEFTLQEDDMVMGMDRPWVSAGVRVARVKRADLPCLLLQRVARIRGIKIESDFLERVLTGHGYKAYFEPILTGVSVPHISPDQIAGYTAAIPPREEQRVICAYINQLEGLCIKARASEQAQIQALQTLRSTLIAHAVTGKINV